MSIVKSWSNTRTSQTQAQIYSHSIPRLDPINSKSSLTCDFLKKYSMYSLFKILVFLGNFESYTKIVSVHTDFVFALHTNQIPIELNLNILTLYETNLLYSSKLN